MSGSKKIDVVFMKVKWFVDSIFRIAVVLTTSLWINSLPHHSFYQDCVWSLQKNY